ncbi:MAG: thiamine diphosphokinase [Candidatus Poseidoniaceae archaeon]
MTPVGGHKMECQFNEEVSGENLTKEGLLVFNMDAEKWVIFCDGDWPDEVVWRPLVDQAECIVACDAAAHQCLERGITPHVVIGDMDSVDQNEVMKNISSIQWIVKEHQDNSDLSKALEFARQYNPTTTDVIGIEGGQKGHQIGAYFALFDAPPQTVLHTQNSRIYCIKNRNLTIDSIEIGSTLSLFALGLAEGVSLTGCEWDLSNEKLMPGTRGLNNIMTTSKLTIDVKNGAVLACLETNQRGPFGR